MRSPSLTRRKWCFTLLSSLRANTPLPTRGDPNLSSGPKDHMEVMGKPLELYVVLGLQVDSVLRERFFIRNGLVLRLKVKVAGV